MSICIAGMHRSGTSMVAGIMRTMGVYLGEEADFLEAKEGENTDGFWEHFGFYALNERLLEHLHLGWDAPWISEGWENRQDLTPFREEAGQLAGRMKILAGGHARWGWKDPRNSITIQFWKSVLPDAKVLVCVRNPVEVALSLRKRNNLSLAASSRLWFRYYENLLGHVPRGDRVVTIYDNYFENFGAEIKRVCASLGLDVDDSAMAGATSCANPGLRHNRATRQDLLGGNFPPELIKMYDCLVNEATAGTVISKRPKKTEFLSRTQTEVQDDSDLARSRFNAETAQREELIRHLIHENRVLTDSLAKLELRLAELTEQMAAASRENLSNAHFLAGKLQNIRQTNAFIGDKQTHWRSLQVEMEKSLKDKPSSIPGWLRNSKAINSLYRNMRRVRKIGKLLLAQSDLDEAIAQSLGQMTDLLELMARSRAEVDAIPRGLERNDTLKIQVDLSELATLLKLRMP